MRSAALLGAMAWATSAAPAGATTVGLTPEGCVFGSSAVAIPGGVSCATQDVGINQNQSALAFGPDGSTLYVATDASALPWLTRSANGTLTPAGCIEDVNSEQNGLGTGACSSAASGQANGIYATVNGVVASAGNVYAIGAGGGQGGTVASFSRGAGGALQYLGCTEDATQLQFEEANGNTPECGSSGARVMPGLAQPRGIAISRDGHNVYVAAGNDVAVLDRGSDGVVTPAGCIADAFQLQSGGGQTSCSTGTALSMASDVAVTPDGRNVYVVSEGDQAVSIFDRSPSGALTPAGCVKTVSNDNQNVSCAKKVAGLVDPRKVVVSPSGRDLYVIAQESIQVLKRSRRGALRNGGCIADAVGNTANISGCSAGSGNLAGLDAVAMSHDGRNLYVGSSGDQAVQVLSTRGGLKLRGCIENPPGGPGCAPGNQIADLGPVDSLAVSPDDKQLYVGEQVGASGVAIAVFGRRPVGPGGRAHRGKHHHHKKRHRRHHKHHRRRR